MIEERRMNGWQAAIDALREEVNALKTVTATIQTEIGALRKLYDEHDKILVRGNGKPSLQEDVRNLVEFTKSLRFWMTAIALAFIGQFFVVGAGLVITLIQLQPLVTEIIKIKNSP